MPDGTGQRPGSWERIQDLFIEALDIPAAERSSWLDDHCHEDPALRAEVEALLRSWDQDSLLGAAEQRPHSPQPALGQIGPYRLLRLLGEGGMGEVYLAERQTADFTQRVALKLLRAGLASAKLEARLRAESRLLARLEHPGIARLIDGGTTPAGQPYVVTEYVEGASLLACCDTQGLPIRERLTLFLEVCAAVSYAHRQFVAHLDIKPGNILVTPEGRAKLLDFGIAKALDREDDGDTRTAPWFTPAYASPEQVRGLHPGTESDIYALGVLLYELLSGHRPYDLDGSSPAEIERIVCETSPEPPSAMAGRSAPGWTTPDVLSRLRSTTPSGLRRTLAGDLDTIVLKAMAKEPGRRYATVDQLAEDIHRYLAGHPVLARRDSPAYRAAKFVRRHRVVVAAGAVVLASLVGGIGATAWQASVAGHERDRAEAALAESERALARSEEVTGFLIRLFEANDPGEAPGDTVTARELLDRGLERAQELRDQPVIQAQLLNTVGRVFYALGNYPEAESTLTRALGLRRRATGNASADVAETLGHLADLRRHLGDVRGADTLYGQAYAIEVATYGPIHAVVGQRLEDLGYNATSLGDLARAESLFRQSLDTRIAALGPGDSLVARSYVTLAAIRRRRGDLEASDSLYRMALALRQRVLGPDHVEVVRTLFRLGEVQHEMGRDIEAERYFREALGILERGNPRDIQMVAGLHGLAAVQSARGDYAGAERTLREAIALEIEARGPASVMQAETEDNLAVVLARLGKTDEALALLQNSLLIEHNRLGASHPMVAGTHSTIGDVYLQLDDPVQAREHFRRAMTIRERVYGPVHPIVAFTLGHLATSWERSGNLAMARANLVRAAEIYQRHYAPDFPALRATRERIARIDSLLQD